VLAWERVCRVATTGPAGVPHVVPVAHVLVDGKICFASEGSAKKGRNLRRPPRATVGVDVFHDDWSTLPGGMVHGDGEAGQQLRTSTWRSRKGNDNGGRKAGSSKRQGRALAVPASGGRFDDEHVARRDFGPVGAAELGAQAVGPLHPVTPA